MKTLVIDNYDSFTWNLVHLIAMVSGEPPTVIMNDEAGWREKSLSAFDNVVITPGPGHPAVPGDFGICSKIFRHRNVPVLGVCLGFQGLCLSAGADVGLAPEPMHGRVSRVRHTGDDLFKNIPSPFSVVRYHSLAVKNWDAAIQPLAFADGDVLMAARRKQSPQWGVQFHPESVATEYGQTIIRNFFALTREWRAAAASRVFDGDREISKCPNATV
jgi:para-aminobenzoate synthetase